MVISKAKKIIPVSFIRLIPAAISTLATFLIILFLGKDQYGLISILLATSSALNAVLFHWTRNLITFQKNLNISNESIKNAWIISLIVTPLPLSFLLLNHSISFIDSFLIIIYLFFQSQFERRIEYFRKNLDLKSYLVISCSRPLLNIFFIFCLSLFLPLKNVSKISFLILAITPSIALAFIKNSFEESFEGKIEFKKLIKGTLKIIPIGIGITVPLSYIFLQDALIKYMIIDHLPINDFGLFAAFSDIALSASWVLVSSLTWDYAPRIQKSILDIHSLLLKKIFGICSLAIVSILFIFVFNRMDILKLLGIEFSISKEFVGVFLNQLLSSALSSLLFVTLILKGFKWSSLTATLLSLGSTALALFYSTINTRFDFIWILLMINSIAFMTSLTLIFLYSRFLKFRQKAS